MFPDSKNKNFYFLNSILLLIIAIMTAYNFLYLQEIDKNKDIKVINEVTEIKEIEKKIPIPCLKCNANTNTHIQEINGVKHHHYIVPDSEFKENGFLKNNCDSVFQRDLKPTLMHSFIKKLNPNYRGWICWTPSFNENNNNKLKIMTEIKHPPLDLVGIYFDKGTRFSGDDGNNDDWDKYTFDEVVKATNGAENVYYFWRTSNMFETYKNEMYTNKSWCSIKIDSNNPKPNKPHCPPFAKVLTQEDIDNL
uniref:Uncharacterized protein n=1 Tax=Beet leafhopper transmitted virescence phytoplasma TaxID=37694 RepID=Q6JKN1_9MOLU|nr:hypothetical protein [Beet leafhopper transmitted virescence phytoplasma]AAR84209.1 unknown [Beet leafhopper transmitted virescence phytoplasma]